jgi:pseudoazurin
MMVFKPAVLKINPGDTVTWKASNPGHNTASINEMSPDNSLQWDGKINEEVKITFSKEGVYGYKCTPHYILGMVGIVSVGDNTVNLSAASEYAINAEKINKDFKRRNHGNYKKVTHSCNIFCQHACLCCRSYYRDAKFVRWTDDGL